METGDSPPIIKFFEKEAVQDTIKALLYAFVIIFGVAMMKQAGVYSGAPKEDVVDLVPNLPDHMLEGNAVYIQKEYQPFIRDFVIEAAKRGVPQDTIVENLAKLAYIGEHDAMKYPFFGAVFEYQKPDSTKINAILLNKSIKFDTLIVKFTIFHELGHAVLNKEHCDCPEDIMHHTSPKSFYRISDPNVWKPMLDRFFQ